ncbi:unnamed protein product [Clavelina lepadiformis]|uniref:Uncharacterized protein n=1 Tax=Clavelina lepadiformis TaxID=159417 RepID=A0ABP0FY21_CLALP
MHESTWTRYLALSYLTISCLFISNCVGSAEEKRLVDFLFTDKKYDSMVRPATTYKEVINVTFTLTLQQIVDLDEKHQLLTTSMYMDWKWTDTYLHWEPEEYGGIKDIRLPAKKVWKPDILIYNSAVDDFDQLLHTNVIVSHDGNVSWLPPGLFKTTCDVDIRYFPFDEQKCEIKFGTWTHHGGLVDLIVETPDATTDTYIPNGAWDLLSMTGLRHSYKYDCCPEEFIDVTYTVHVRRRTLFYAFHLILPCLLVCSLTILVFMLPADSGERITLGITVLLALVVFLQLVAQALPPTDVIPVLGKFFACSIIMVAFSVLLTVISLSFHHTSTENTNRMPNYIRWIFLYALPKVLHMTQEGENSFHNKALKRAKAKEDEEKQFGYTQNEEGMQLVVSDKLGKWQESNPSEDQGMTELKIANEEMKSILKEVRFITERLHNEDEDEQSAAEWKFAAVVLDKFCIWVFSIYFVFSTLFTIGIAPGVLSPMQSD